MQKKLLGGRGARTFCRGSPTTSLAAYRYSQPKGVLLKCFSLNNGREPHPKKEQSGEPRNGSFTRLPSPTTLSLYIFAPKNKEKLQEKPFYQIFLGTATVSTLFF